MQINRDRGCDSKDQNIFANSSKIVSKLDETLLKVQPYAFV